MLGQAGSADGRDAAIFTVAFLFRFAAFLGPAALRRVRKAEVGDRAAGRRSGGDRAGRYLGYFPIFGGSDKFLEKEGYTVAMLDLICAYENYLTDVKQASNNTVSSYMRDIRKFSGWLRDKEEIDVVDATQKDISDFLDYLQEAGKSGATCSRALASLKNFYGYLVSSGFLKASPVQCVKLERPEKKDPQILSDQEIERLLAQPSQSEPKGIRDRAMLQVMYATGIRVSELIGLNLENVNLDLGVISVGEKKVRRIPLYPEALATLRTYITTVRETMAQAGENALFVNVSGVRMSRQGFWKLLKHYQAQAHIDSEITPHTLRHSFAVHLLERGADLDCVQELMGHSDISSTQMYTHMVDEHVRSVYEKCHPKSNT